MSSGDGSAKTKTSSLTLYGKKKEIVPWQGNVAHPIHGCLQPVFNFLGGSLGLVGLVW